MHIMSGHLSHQIEHHSIPIFLHGDIGKWGRKFRQFAERYGVPFTPCGENAAYAENRCETVSEVRRSRT